MSGRNTKIALKVKGHGRMSARDVNPVRVHHRTHSYQDTVIFDQSIVLQFFALIERHTDTLEHYGQSPRRKTDCGGGDTTESLGLNLPTCL